MSRQTVLLLNLGSPDSPEVPDVRRYLKQFLSDRRVLDTPAPLRKLVLNLFILPRRPKNSAHAYQQIWTPEGSPLIVTSRRVQKLLASKIDLPVELAMRYGSPSTEEVVDRIVASGTQEILLIPLYPHYAMSSFETAVVCVQESLARQSRKVQLTVLPPFYQDPDYIDAMVASAKPYLEKEHDHLLFSFHGIPERHLKQDDSSKKHCLMRSDCCETPNGVHRTCYRHQCFMTVKAFVERAGIPGEKYSVSFQSRLGREPWLHPYTDHVVHELPSKGIRKLLVICPAFVSDCLETLEEIAIREQDAFLKSGGSSFVQIPCMNEHPRWIDALVKFTDRLRQGNVPDVNDYLISR